MTLQCARNLQNMLLTGRKLLDIHTLPIPIRQNRVSKRSVDESFLNLRRNVCKSGAGLKGKLALQSM